MKPVGSSSVLAAKYDPSDAGMASTALIKPAVSVSRPEFPGTARPGPCLPSIDPLWFRYRQSRSRRSTCSPPSSWLLHKRRRRPVRPAAAITGRQAPDRDCGLFRLLRSPPRNNRSSASTWRERIFARCGLVGAICYRRRLARALRTPLPNPYCARSTSTPR